MFKQIAIVAVSAAFVVASAASVIAEGPGKCSTGMKWDAGSGKCVAKPGKGSGSGATKGSGSGATKGSGSGATKGKGSGSGSG